MIVHIIGSACNQMLLFLPLSFGIYLSYCVMKTTDLTVEATYVLGAALFARMISQGVAHPWALILALTVPSLAGIAVALMRKIARIDGLIASVLAIYMLYSINFKVMGRPNINLLSEPLWLLNNQHNHPVAVWGSMGLLMLVLLGLLGFLFHSRFGLLLRAIGTNESLAKNFGYPTLWITLFGLMLSNSLAALSGVLTTQITGFADIDMGLGMALTAIGAMMIGMTLCRRHHALRFNAWLDLAACALGVFVYFIILNAILSAGVNPIYLKLLMGLMLVLFLSSAARRKD